MKGEGMKKPSFLERVFFEGGMKQREGRIFF